MMYIWRGNLRLRHLSAALTAPTQLTNHLEVDLGLARKVNFDDEFRAGGRSGSDSPGSPRPLTEYVFFSPGGAEIGTVPTHLVEEERRLTQSATSDPIGHEGLFPSDGEHGFCTSPGRSGDSHSLVLKAGVGALVEVQSSQDIASSEEEVAVLYETEHGEVVVKQELGPQTYYEPTSPCRKQGKLRLKDENALPRRKRRARRRVRQKERGRNKP